MHGKRQYGKTPEKKAHSLFLPLTLASRSENKTRPFLMLLPALMLPDLNQNGIRIICERNRGCAL